jgi:sulfhydrogenase subunit beta (sulfur reductase)
MKVVKINKARWDAGLDALKGDYRLFGPVKAKEGHAYKVLDKGESPDFNLLNTRLSPKAIVFPQSEEIIEFSLDENDDDHHIMKAVADDPTPRAVIGMRPCDARAMTLLNLNFDTAECKDPYWVRGYEATTFVGLGCDAPYTTCFCTSAGCGPYDEQGLDVLLTDNGDHFLAKVLTDKGQALMAKAGWEEEVEGAAVFASKTTEAEAKIVSRIETDKLGETDTLTLHGADFWEDISFACINCGTCTFLCPTCWCFDLQDEIHGKSGKRLKNWDSCMFPLFTMHTTGHNPRGTKMQRVRQRFMHKLKYFVDKYGQGTMCVGCGRCVRQCPVNIDIRKVCALMNSQATADSCVVEG